MSENIRALVKEHHAFYEVSPYHVLLEERPVGQPPTTRSIQAGFHVDVYGVRIEDNEPAMPRLSDYGLAYGELERIAKRISQHASHSCTLEVIPFASTAIIDNRKQGQVEYLIRIRISHRRGLDQRAGLSEEEALQEVERELKNLGIARR